MVKDDEKCAPTKKYNEGSCFTLDQLKKMAKSYNNFIEVLSNPILDDEIVDMGNVTQFKELV